MGVLSLFFSSLGMNCTIWAAFLLLVRLFRNRLWTDCLPLRASRFLWVRTVLCFSVESQALSTLNWSHKTLVHGAWWVGSWLCAKKINHFRQKRPKRTPGTLRSGSLWRSIIFKVSLTQSRCPQLSGTLSRDHSTTPTAVSVTVVRRAPRAPRRGRRGRTERASRWRA